MTDASHDVPPVQPPAPGAMPPAPPQAQQPPAAYPLQQPGYPPQQPGYPQTQPPADYPQQQPAGYPQQQPGYPPQQQPAGYPQPQYGYPAAGYPYGYAPAPSGRKFWALQFLYYIPWVGVIVVLIVALVQRAQAKTSPHEIVRENARWAANWALSYTLYLFVGALMVGLLLAVPTSNGDPSPLGAIPGLLIFGIGIYCLVTIIRGTVIADRVVHRPALAIPYFRR